MTDPDRTIIHFVTIEEDITDAQFIDQVLYVVGRVLRHNVRNSVTVINGYADLLESELDTEEHKTAVQVIREHANKLGKLSNETRSIRELFHRRHTEHSLPVDAIEGFVQKHRDMHPDAVFNFSLEVPEGIVVHNGSLLQLAIDEALENAVVHNDQHEPRVEVRVTYLADRAELCVEIADNGLGIPDDEWNVLIAGKETPLAHTSGIGLWLIYWTVTALGGQLTVPRMSHAVRFSPIRYRLRRVEKAKSRIRINEIWAEIRTLCKRFVLSLRIPTTYYISELYTN